MSQSGWWSSVSSWLGAGTWGEWGVSFPRGGVLPGDSRGAGKGREVAGIFTGNCCDTLWSLSQVLG